MKMSREGEWEKDRQRRSSQCFNMVLKLQQSFLKGMTSYVIILIHLRWIGQVRFLNTISPRFTLTKEGHFSDILVPEAEEQMASYSHPSSLCPYTSWGQPNHFGPWGFKKRKKEKSTTTSPHIQKKTLATKLSNNWPFFLDPQNLLSWSNHFTSPNARDGPEWRFFRTNVQQMCMDPGQLKS